MDTIIIQDTEKDILEMLTIMLEIEHFTVYSILECSPEILDMIDAYRPHVVMLDYRIDGEECIAICHQIKSRYPHLPVIAMSCNSNINNLYDRDGFDDYIPKPFDIDQLYKVLRAHIPKTESTLDNQI